MKEECDGCPWYGITDCTREHGVTRCYECPEFPCGTLERFSGEPIINGGCHHADGISNNRRMAEIGVDA